MSHTYAPRNAQPGTRPMTEKQRAFISTLWAEKDTSGITLPPLNAMTLSLASDIIDKLLDAPRKAHQPSAQDVQAVPAGRYALRGEDGVVRFYVVDRPTTGRWAGRSFLKVQASDKLHPVRGAAGDTILSAIALDPRAASALYGQELGVCGVCGRTLTDEESRARGIGPVCADRL